MKKLLEQRTHLGATKLYFEQQKQQQLRHKMHNNIRAGYNVEQRAKVVLPQFAVMIIIIWR